MKVALTMAACVLCAAVIIFGKIHWQHRIDSMAMVSLPVNEKDVNNRPFTDSSPETTSDDQPKNDIQSLTADLPEKLSEKIVVAAQSGGSVQLLAVVRSKKETWPTLLQSNLNERYGEGFFKITVQAYGNKTTFDYLDSKTYQSLFQPSSGTDILLFESFILNDKGKVSTNDTMLGMKKLYAQVHAAFPELIFILQPPNPIYGSSYYSDHVEQLEQLAKDEGILYINHWNHWPDFSDKQLQDDLQEDHLLPNDKGNALWADYLFRYLTSQLEPQ